MATTGGQIDVSKYQTSKQRDETPAVRLRESRVQVPIVLQIALPNYSALAYWLARWLQEPPEGDAAMQRLLLLLLFTVPPSTLLTHTPIPPPNPYQSSPPSRERPRAPRQEAQPITMCLVAYSVYL